MANHRFELLSKAIFERTLANIADKLNGSLEELLHGRSINELTHSDISNYHQRVDFVSNRPTDLLIQVEYRQENG